jgi:hypothetical protein
VQKKISAVLWFSIFFYPIDGKKWFKAKKKLILFNRDRLNKLQKKKLFSTHYATEKNGNSRDKEHARWKKTLDKPAY